MAPRSTSAGRPEAPNSAASPEGSRPRPSSAGSAGPMRACLLEATTSALESRKVAAPAAWAARGPTQTATGTLASATTRSTSAGGPAAACARADPTWAGATWAGAGPACARAGAGTAPRPTTSASSAPRHTAERRRTRWLMAGPLFPRPTRAHNPSGQSVDKADYDGGLMPLDVLDRARLVVVTGKGGTGKTTVAAALAVAAAQRGRRTLVAEVEGRQGLSALFGRATLGHRETELAERVNGLAVEPEASLREYLGRYGFAPLARLLSWARLTSFVTAAAPGLGDILLVGKVWEAATRRAGQRRVYDLVVLDAPPTGRVVPFLRAPETVAELARVGPLRHQAARGKD